MHRKVELQSPADYTYLYANTVTASRQKLDLHFPPSATGHDDPDPMRERVRELVDEYITKTFTSASPSLNINGLDDTHPLPSTTTTATSITPSTVQSLQLPAETIEYEPFDTDLAARVTALYAQLESLTTTVAQLRRDAPRKAAGAYAEELARVLDDDDDEEEAAATAAAEDDSHGDREGGTGVDFGGHVPGNHAEVSRWRNGDMAETYDDALRTLLRLQGEDSEMDGNALASTVGKAERAGRAADVVEKM